MPYLALKQRRGEKIYDETDNQWHDREPVHWLITDGFCSRKCRSEKRNIISVTEMKNLQEVYKELFDEAVERYNVGNEMIERLPIIMKRYGWGNRRSFFHEVIFQIGNCGDMAVGTEEGELAVKILDEFLKRL